MSNNNGFLIQSFDLKQPQKVFSLASDQILTKDEINFTLKIYRQKKKKKKQDCNHLTPFKSSAFFGFESSGALQILL